MLEDLLTRIWKSSLFSLKEMEFIPNNLGNKLIGEEIIWCPTGQDVYFKKSWKSISLIIYKIQVYEYIVIMANLINGPIRTPNRNWSLRLAAFGQLEQCE